MDKENMIHIHIREYYSAINKNEIMLLAGKWMELKILLNEISKMTWEDKYCMLSLICRV
jgi:hypothetical protein